MDVSENEQDNRAILWKEWTRYGLTLARIETQKVNAVIKAQQKALDLLYTTSINLYSFAIQPCPTVLDLSEKDHADAPRILPISVSGPYTTPPTILGDVISSCENYEAPDGDRADVTPVIHYKFELNRQFLAEPKKKKMNIKKSNDRDID